MRHSLLSVVLLLLSTSFVLGGNNWENNSEFHGCTCPEISTTFGATLTIEDEIPRPNTTASIAGGGILLRVIRNETDNSLILHYELFARAQNITAAHIHVGPRCVAGPVVVLLASSDSQGGVPLTNATNPLLFSSGNITEENFTGPLIGSPFNDLIVEIENGNAYVNVHTTEFPSGIIRGQVQAAAPESLTRKNLSETLECAPTSPPSTFFTLLEESGIISNETEANFTIFAPSEFAWDLFGRETLDIANETQIGELLLAHVVEGVFSFSDFLGTVTELTALDGVTQLTINGTLPPTAAGGTDRDVNLTSSLSPQVTVNGVLITGPDMLVATDAIVHEIQLVLTPNTTNGGGTTGTTGTGTGVATTGTGGSTTGGTTTGGATTETGTGGTLGTGGGTLGTGGGTLGTGGTAAGGAGTVSGTAPSSGAGTYTAAASGGNPSKQKKKKKTGHGRRWI